MEHKNSWKTDVDQLIYTVTQVILQTYNMFTNSLKEVGGIEGDNRDVRAQNSNPIQLDIVQLLFSSS